MILNFNKPCYISSFSFIYNIKKRHKLKKIVIKKMVLYVNCNKLFPKVGFLIKQ